ncbi:hypothetical protein BKA62DRAFT_54770 [Auriculariales sp. MPI-PUGE-AT-0066]|nr:hypothetical protein BKA62DRAFT_54770 [Auriculariales sp. MPI-PUGE-AT-0066]
MDNGDLEGEGSPPANQLFPTREDSSSPWLLGWGTGCGSLAAWSAAAANPRAWTDREPAAPETVDTGSKGVVGRTKRERGRYARLAPGGRDKRLTRITQSPTSLTRLIDARVNTHACAHTLLRNVVDDPFLSRQQLFSNCQSPTPYHVPGCCDGVSALREIREARLSANCQRGDNDAIIIWSRTPPCRCRSKNALGIGGCCQSPKQVPSPQCQTEIFVRSY